MNNLIKIFEGQEIKVQTNKGVTLINLVATAKVCGLVREDGKYLKIRWDDVRKKLNLILESVMVEPSTKKYMEEINFILEEIENTDDRNSIYMSSWLSKRLALECHSEKAMRYKNFLVTLDETRENIQSAMPNTVDAQTVLKLAEGMMSIGDVVQGLHKSMTVITEYVKDSINSKDLQIDKAMDLIGFRAVNTKRLSDKLKDRLSDMVGFNITASSTGYQKVKKMIFKKFDVVKWEDVPVSKYNSVYAFVDGLEKSEIGF